VFAVTAANDLSERLGVQLRSITEPINTATPMGRTVLAILAGMAEQERQVITERTFLGRREKATRGDFAGGAAPLGHRRDRQSELEADEWSAEIVRRIFVAKGLRPFHRGHHTIQGPYLGLDPFKLLRCKPSRLEQFPFVLEGRQSAQLACELEHDDPQLSLAF
jgi:hypothetical protein